jgi:hypothetical protein
MTTIVYKHPILAADRQVTLDDHMRILCENKIEILDNGWIFAGAGLVHDIHLAKRYFQNPSKFKKIPKTKSSFCCLLVKDEKVFYAEGSLNLQLLETPYYAIGTGYKFAYLSLSQGKTAVQALQEASALDIYTSPEYTFINIEDYAQSKKKKARKSKNFK